FTKGFVESSKNGKVISSGIDASGAFLNAVDTGTYITTVNLGGNSYYTVKPISKTSIFSSFNNKDSFDFALVPVGIKNDLTISLQAITSMRPGFEATYRIDYSNAGTSTIANTVIKFIKPAATSFVSATLVPSSVTVDTISWNIGSMSPFDAADIKLVLKSGAPPVVNIGDELKFSAAIDPVDGDILPINNTDTLHQTVRGSFDPNDKQENHDGSLYFAQLQAGQSLTYTVRFQNMGTDTAFNIIVKDTVSDKLDISTLEIVGASHPYQVNIKDNKYATFTFNDILLPDHNINETASHGYITYRIKPKSNVQLGDRIYNSASIYFDYNLPVQTNKHETTVRLIPVPTPVISGLQLSYCGKQGAQSAKILNLPASTSGITVNAKLDATVLTIAADSTVSFTVSSVAAGTHNFTVTYSTVTDVITTTASIVITAVAAPDVNLSANITNVGNLANAVIVTATNASGGGKNPLYTFAWNNGITNIVQAESSNNTVSIPASSLSLGDNKVYVKMKTSENCYSALENIDSINIRRDVSTGIIDSENPGQVITVYPNPVHGPVTVYGLITSKSYTFTIVNLQGQAVFSKRVANQSTANINDFNSAAGMYWLTIYDEKNNRTLGTVKLIKQ
ncbi:MAG TPA: T9SS type A sorting domain-containing protein, partial [Niastella sp.]